MAGRPPPPRVRRQRPRTPALALWDWQGILGSCSCRCRCRGCSRPLLLKLAREGNKGRNGGREPPSLDGLVDKVARRIERRWLSEARKVYALPRHLYLIINLRSRRFHCRLSIDRLAPQRRRTAPATRSVVTGDSLVQRCMRMMLTTSSYLNA